MLIILTVLCTVAAASPESAPHRIDLNHGFYLIARPTGFDEETPLPLVICLHGTNTTAADMLAFWQSLDHTLPFVFVAPQAIKAGWRDGDQRLVREFLADLPSKVTFDPQRVLLAGHSAGGAMALHCLYVERFPATAAVVTACYVPPTVKADHVHRTPDIPVFYAVGSHDVNQERMRRGLTLLRHNGVSVTVRRPPIGHELNRAVAQSGLNWFESLCRERIQKILETAADDARHERAPGPSAAALEAIVRHADTRFPDQIDRATSLLATLQQPGRIALFRASRLLSDDQPLAARAELIRVEQQYAESSLAAEAQRRRATIEAMPEVADHLRTLHNLRAADSTPAAGTPAQ
jgi:predicted esterase